MSFICFDTEDNARELQEAGLSGFGKVVTQIAAIKRNGTRFHNRGNVHEFKAWLSKQPEQFFYSLNIQYDLGNLFGKELDELDCVLVGGRIIRATWRKKTFVDVFNIWPMSTQKLGEKFGLKKLEFDANSEAYVFRDVEIIRAAMEFAWQFVGHLGLKYLPATLGGLCIKVWKHWGGTNCHDSTKLCREAYFGGRVEIFKTHNESANVCWTDINSLYPAVMRQPFPDMLSDWEQELPPHGIAQVTVNVPKQDLVILPYRNEFGRIIFPYGTFTGTWTMPEIRAAQEQGTKIVKVHKAYGSETAGFPYTTFVERLYTARLASQSEAEKLFFKLLMNNLYGRLGTKGTIGRTVFQTDENKNSGVPYGEKVLVEYQMPLSEETNWCHAAYTTAYGRLELFKYLKEVGAKNLIYCDTDSVIFDCATKRIPFEIGDGLGQMKKGVPVCLCDNKKKGITCYCGAKKFLETGHAVFNLPFKIREAIRFYDRKNSRQLSVWRQVEKHNRQTYDRKRLIKNRYFPCKVNNVL